ncbi:MAG: diacylglycerol kinase family lipid kinase [Anaerolineales bacterium]|nr:diacylglycerol kinase family lipid kinase [Anaerolineales bacterium]
MTKRCAWLLYNPAAGRFPAGPLLERALRVLTAAGWDAQIVEGEKNKGLTDVAKEAVAQRCDAVFVVGGDGSVGQVASALAGSETALGVLPAGTANVWAQELGLPRLDWIHLFALEQAAESLASGDVRLVDVGECNGQAFLLWAGVGLDAHVVSSIEPRERWEKAFATVHYATLALWNTIGWEGMDLKVRTEKDEFEGRYLVAVASNIPAYAGGLVDLAPGAKVDDGLLDFWFIESGRLRDVLVRVAQIFMGRHVEAEGVYNFQASEAVFELENGLPMQCDGEPKVLDSPLEFSVRRKALKVLVPSDVDPALFASKSDT